MPDSPVTLKKQGDLSIITIDDGKANVFNVEMTSALIAALDEVDIKTGAVIIRGREGIYSGGYDLNVETTGSCDEDTMAGNHTSSTAEVLDDLNGTLEDLRLCCADDWFEILMFEGEVLYVAIDTPAGQVATVSVLTPDGETVLGSDTAGAGGAPPVLEVQPNSISKLACVTMHS